ncbi:MAG: peptidylprolyl isomerase [Thiomonas sp.]|uniref:peptidylprolyl isomerase n=1 Tax=Thiomonas sp. TaxID=2047785 RepID=UPI002A36FBE2|nr:peptidylprolyl isomerase [Thiomonas sp.]MDY0331169.1 peptidylprolyl isomerase [Thiomonas sp.]
MNTPISAPELQVEAVLDRLRQRAAELGIQADDDEALLEAVLQHDVQIPEPGLAECQRYYAQHADALRQGDMVEADHILFAVTPTTPIDALRTKAEDTLYALMADASGFAEMARGLSNCPSAQVGGNLGQLTAEQCVPEFWQALMEHGEPGLLPRLVRSRFGLHIVRIARIAKGQLPPFEAVQAQIAQTLRQQSLVRALQLYAEDLGQHVAPAEGSVPAVACPSPQH